MPANATIIGRVAVKVLPDTTEFRRDAQRKLDTQEKRLVAKASLALDTVAAQRQLLEDIRELNAKNKATDSRKVKLYTNLVVSDARRQIAGVVREYNLAAKSAKKVDLATNLVAGKLDLELDDENLKQVERDIDHWRRKIEPVKIKVKLDLSHTAKDLAAAQIAKVSRDREVRLFPRVDNKAAAAAMATLAALSGARVLESMLTRLKNVFKNLDKNVPIIGSIALAVAGLAGWGLTAASNLFALSSSLAQIGPAALALPGLLGGIAVGVGTMVAALKDFNTIFPDVKKSLSTLQDTISTNFWAKAQAPMRDMIDHLLPQFSKGFAEAATELGGYFGKLSTALKGSFDGEIKGMFHQLAESISIASKGTGSLTNLITIFGKTGASYLPSMAQWFVNLTDKFDGFISKAAGDGRLQQWIDNATTLLGQLGQVVKNLGGILGGLGSAALKAGGSGLAQLADTLKAVNNAVHEKGFQDTLVAVLTAAHQMMHNIAVQSGPAFKALFKALGTTFSQIAPMIGTTIGKLGDVIFKTLGSPAVQKGLRDLFTGLSQGVSSLAPALTALAPVLGHLGSLLGTFAKAFGPVIGAALKAIAPVVDTLMTAIEPLITLLSGALTDVITELAPILKTLAKAFAKVIPPIVDGLKPILKAIIPIIGQLAKLIGNAAAQILPMFGKAIGQLLPALAPVLKSLLELLVKILTPLMPAIIQIVQQALPPLTDALVALLPALIPLLDGFGKLIGYLMPVLVPALRFLAQIITSTVVGAINGVTKIIRGLVEHLSGVFSFIKDLFTLKWGRLWGDTKKIFKGAWDLIVGIVQTIWNVVILSKFRAGWAAIKGLFTEGPAKVKALWEGLWNGVKDIGSKVWTWIKDQAKRFWDDLTGPPGRAIDKIKDLVSKGWDKIKGFFKDAWSKITDGVSKAWDKVIGFFKDAPGKMLKALGDLGHILFDAGKKIIQGLVDGIKAGFGKVKHWLGKLTSWIPKWKGPEDTDSKLLYKAGQLIIQGLNRGLASQFGAVRSALAGFTKDIRNVASGALKARLTNDDKDLKKLLSKWNTAANALAKAKAKLDSLRQESSEYFANIKSSIVGTGNVTGFEDTSFKGIVKGLKQAKNKAQEFAKVLAKLKKAGLNKTALDQIAQAGPEAGLASAESILNAGKDGIAEINRLQKQLAEAAGAAAKTAADSMYANGIKTAEGFVKGLKDHEKDIEGQMLKIAKAMVKAIKDALGIHSPSRVFHELGSFVGKGLLNGLESQYDAVRKSLTGFANELGDVNLGSPSIAVGGRLSAIAGSAHAGTNVSNQKTFNYYAAPGNSLPEEDLFAAVGRSRFAW